eukprot:CAMPEP_0179339668 /NCGR_PEP_ID=MMETSP0797-20121207/68845_1 /TAXON_ID=47934 /ORGANISM="Dinophysis acuminata, Strain DAEP01" /LENGTH=100 /DNA_ID=CAMNT_0021053529 /DNA_START=335 /DNA_END=633 /DNA_ORIENTATION=+
MRRFQGNSGTYMPAYSAPATRESRTPRSQGQRRHSAPPWAACSRSRCAPRQHVCPGDALLPRRGGGRGLFDAEARVAEEAQRGPRLRAGRGAGARPPDGP